MGQLTGAVKQDTTNNPLANMNYFYDLIGNRTSATENSATTTYTSNIVNQYTAVNAVVPVYDLDGNMTNYNGWTYTYNGENRLIVAENAATGVRVEADYDYMGRRIFKKVYNSNALTKHSVYVYDGFKQIAEFDALNNNSLKASYLWQPVGLDIVLLRNNEYLVADGNKNIIQVRNATGSVTDSYVYDPFGKVTHNGSSENPFRFSSEFSDSETGLVYYNYRYYMPELGRWINRDPIEEDGGMNLYVMIDNKIVNNLDMLGLQYLLLLYDSADTMFSKWADAVEKKIKSSSKTYFGAKVKFNKKRDVFAKIAVKSIFSFDELKNYSCVKYLASFGHGKEGRIWWDVGKKGNSIVTGIPGYRTTATKSIDFSTLADINFTDDAVIEFYHCYTARMFNVDRTGLLTFPDDTSSMPESPNNARESILTYYKKLLHNQGYGDITIYGSPRGISNGYPFFRGYPRIFGSQKKTTEDHHHVNCPYCGGN